MIQKYSFKDFLTKEVELISNGEVYSKTKIDVIEIPMIQRDYAQGRLSFSKEKNKNILNATGEKFIKELFLCLTDDALDTQLELDFVYGSIKKIEDTVYFYPLDGQQRLTTLFLLYWYIGGAELNTEDRKELADVLKNFYYATRTSSNLFCEKIVKELCSDNIDFLLRRSTENEKTDTLVSQIENLSWFHDSYKSDPTVQSMLNMLDKIQELYIEHHSKNIFEMLEKLRFYILPLSNFDLTEDLYVKMNARGKQLTSFENFKADFQHWIKKNALSNGFCDTKYDGRLMPYDMFFINKMDNEWAQCFWNLLKESKDKNFDPLFLSFLYKYWFHEYVYNSTSSNKKIDKEIDFILLREEPEYMGFALFERTISKKMLENLQILLDAVSEHYEEIKLCIQPVWETGDSQFDLLKGDYGFKERVAFSAAVLYLVKHTFDDVAFSEWMRVVWNIIENSDIDSARVMVGVMQLISELSPYANNIYSMLADENTEIKSSQSSDVIKEERLKARLLLSKPEWNEPILEAEAHPYFKGSISFLIPEGEDIEQFKHNYQMAKIFFDNNGISQKYRDNSHIFLRALLSRYSSLSDIKYHITDRSEKENSLKKMLTSDPVVRTAIIEWFALDSVAEIEEKLFDEVKKVSPIAVADNDFEKKLHESLYKETDLINWMQERGAIRYRDNYIAKPNSWYDWIYVNGYRNEIIENMVNAGWECENRCYITEGENKKVIPYFWSGDKELLLKKVVNHKGSDVLVKCVVDRAELSICWEENRVTANYLDSVTNAGQLPAFMEYIETMLDTCLAGS